jgi:hypothetical protein
LYSAGRASNEFGRRGMGLRLSIESAWSE